MQAVMAFTKRAFASKATAQGAGKAGAGGGDPWSGKSLGGMSRGMSALGSLMEFAETRAQAGAMDQEARDERLAARQEYVVAAQRVSAIDASYNALVGQQMSAAVEMGLDVGSGSVVAARDEARDAAERERRVLRNSADLNAAQRRLRAQNLREAAKNARIGGAAKLAFGLGAAAFGG